MFYLRGCSASHVLLQCVGRNENYRNNVGLGVESVKMPMPVSSLSASPLWILRGSKKAKRRRGLAGPETKAVRREAARGGVGWTGAPLIADHGVSARRSQKILEHMKLITRPANNQ